MTPQEKKYIKIGVGVGVGVLLLYLFTKSKDNGGTPNDPTGNNGTVNPSFDANQIRLELFYAMNKIGTDESKIIETLRYVSPSDFDKVIKAFGKERYTDYLGYKTSFGTERDLLYWLNAEMSDSSEYSNLKRKFKKLY